LSIVISIWPFVEFFRNYRCDKKLHFFVAPVLFLRSGAAIWEAVLHISVNIWSTGLKRNYTNAAAGITEQMIGSFPITIRMKALMVCH
jgi:hypothetical protein